MRITNLEKETKEETTRDRVLKIAKSLKPGQGILVSEVAKELGLNVTTIRISAKSLDSYVVKYQNGKKLAFVTAPSK